MTYSLYHDSESVTEFQEELYNSFLLHFFMVIYIYVFHLKELINVDLILKWIYIYIIRLQAFIRKKYYEQWLKSINFSKREVGQTSLNGDGMWFCKWYLCLRNGQIKFLLCYAPSYSKISHLVVYYDFIYYIELWVQCNFL